MQFPTHSKYRHFVISSGTEEHISMDECEQFIKEEYEKVWGSVKQPSFSFNSPPTTYNLDQSQELLSSLSIAAFNCSPHIKTHTVTSNSTKKMHLLPIPTTNNDFIEVKKRISFKESKPMDVDYSSFLNEDFFLDKHNLQTHVTIGQMDDFSNNNETYTKPPLSPQDDRMLIDDLYPHEPLIFIDGANVAYAYAQALGIKSSVGGKGQGIQLAVDYFCKSGCQVRVVLPDSWLHSSRKSELMNILIELQNEGKICTVPSNDDDDAYMICMARREEARSLVRTDQKQRYVDKVRGVKKRFIDIKDYDGAYVLSNDLFRDAIKRDKNDDGVGNLCLWLNGTDVYNNKLYNHYERKGHLSLSRPPGRISYSFCDMGLKDDYGNRIMDFIPNPRHELVDFIESRLRSGK